MLMNRQCWSVCLTIGCLFSLWLFFGCLELAERLDLVPETTAADQTEQDPDQDALLQLASGLKSDVPGLDAPCCVSFAAAMAIPPVSFSLSTDHQTSQLMVHSPPSLRLHQQLSVYRI